MVATVLLTEFVQPVVEAFDEVSLGEELICSGLPARLDFYAGGCMLQAEEEGPSVFEILGSELPLSD